MFSLACKSIRNRWPTAMLAILAIVMSVALILTVEKVRHDARSSFTQTVSGTDLVVGARSGAIQLLLYSVFRIGNATNNISWESVQDVVNRPGVAWAIPLSLGDSHKGFRVVGTNNALFEHFRFGNDRSLELQEGDRFDDVFDTVIGSEVAETLGYTVGQSIVVAHGTGNVGLVEHDNQPFVVSGILKRTGTPVDRAVHVSLQGIEAMHVDWQSGARKRGEGTQADTIRGMDLQPGAATAILVGLKSRGMVFKEQRAINTYAEEALLAILPGVALQELWSLVGVAESALFIVSISVVVCGLINLITVLLAGLNERRREMAILRSAGARPAHVFLLLCIESTLLTICGVVLGLGLYYLAVSLGGYWLQNLYGINLTLSWPGRNEMLILGTIVLAGLLAGTLPALSAYRKSLSDGMAQRL